MVEIEGVPYWTDAIGQIPFALNEYRNVFERSKNSEIAAGETIDIGKKFGDGSLMNIIFPSPDNSNGYDNAMIVRAVNWAKKRYRLTPTRMPNGQYEMGWVKQVILLKICGHTPSKRKNKRNKI